MGMVSSMSVDLLDEKSAARLLSDVQLNHLITVLTNERDCRKEEVKNKAIQNFYDAWLKLRELGITPRYSIDGDDEYFDLSYFDNFHF